MDDDNLPQQDEERPRIKVVDRRKFAADGTLRPSEEVAPEAREADESARASTPDEAGADRADGARPAHGSDEESTQRPREGTEAAASAAQASPRESPPAPDAGPGDEPERNGDASPVVGPQPSIADLPRDFAALVEGMYFEAMLYLGAIPDPRTGQAMDDPELAKYKIDLLSMLQAKTEGNLAPEEKQQLEEALYQLRMAYLQKTKVVKL